METAAHEAPEAFMTLHAALDGDADDEVWKRLHALVHEMSSGTHRDEVVPVELEVESYRDADTGQHFGISFSGDGYKPLKELVSAVFVSEGIRYTGPSATPGIFSVQYEHMVDRARRLVGAVNAVASDLDTADELQDR